MGIGHLRRCLALADRLRHIGADVLVITRNLGVDSIEQIRSAGFNGEVLPAPDTAQSRAAIDAAGPKHKEWAGVEQLLDAEQTCSAVAGFAPNWVVIDHYAFDAEWHRAVCAGANARIAVIDDLGDRKIAASLLVDQTLSGDYRRKYAHDKSTIERLLGGPRFALLGAAYGGRAGYRFRERVESIGIFVGGTDPWNASETALIACRTVGRFSGRIQVATTHGNSRLSALREACNASPNTDLLVDLPDLADFFSEHDIQIGAGGGAAWERCCMGAPTILTVLASNHLAVADGLAREGVVVAISDPSVASLGVAVAALAGDPARRSALSARGRALVDGRGAWRVALCLCSEIVALREATVADAEMAHRWRNDPRTRAFFRNPDSVPYQDHALWWRRAIADPDRRLLVATCGREAVGTLRLDVKGSGAEVSLYVDPEATGLGLGLAMLRAGQQWVVEREPQLIELRAEVLPGNRVSCAAFEAAQFRRDEHGLWVWRVA